MSDEGRDAVAETLGSLLGAIGIPALGVVGVVVLILVGGHALISLFPSKVHRWCGGRGHWGVGPFRRKCGSCSGSGLVDR